MTNRTTLELLDDSVRINQNGYNITLMYELTWEQAISYTHNDDYGELIGLISGNSVVYGDKINTTYQQLAESEGLPFPDNKNKIEFKHLPQKNQFLLILDCDIDMCNIPQSLSDLMLFGRANNLVVEYKPL